MRENLRVYPLAEADSPPETVFHDPTGQVWDTLPYFDETYFQDIWNIVQNEPIRERDKAMYGVLREIGIEKGKPLDTSEEWTSIYVEGAQCAFNYLQDIFYTPGKGLYPYYGDDNQWGAFAIPMEQAPLAFPMEEDGVPLINARATFYFYGTYLPARLGPSSFYIIANRDANGEILNGNDTYKLTIAGDAPARDFWSIIAYSALTKGFIRDAETVGFSSREMEALNVSDDGSVDVYFAPEAPRGWESNWIPTGEDWFGLFRLYGPEEAAFDKTFVLPNIEKVE